MISTDLSSLRRWFSEYVRTFYSTDADVQAHVRLKEEHTARVCERMAELSASLALAPEQAALAQMVALFHDVGRFEQYTRYRTFNDFRSEDHACMGVRILQETGVLAELPEDRQVLIYKAVRYHNGREIPADCVEVVSLARMIRDADKIDILAMIASEDALFQMLPLPEYGDMRQVSPGTLESIRQQQVARFEHIRTAADLMLFRMSWMFDMNFPWTFRTVRERNFLEKMAGKLPDSREVQSAVGALIAYRDQRASCVE
jgi:hypothetical protein